MILGITIGAIVYAAFVAFVARFASPKWHPDRGRGYDPERYQ